MYFFKKIGESAALKVLNRYAALVGAFNMLCFAKLGLSRCFGGASGYGVVAEREEVFLRVCGGENPVLYFT